MAAPVFVTDAQRLVFNTVSRKLAKENGAEAIMLGATDLALAFNQQNTAFPLVDCAAIHVDAIVRLATP
jgi:aspartate racemase